MKRLAHQIRTILTLRCEEASRLMSDGYDRRLLWWERWAIRGHLIACRVCPGVKRQLELVTRTAESSSLDGEPRGASEVSKSHAVGRTHAAENNPSGATSQCLAPECREEILRKMREAG